MKRINLFTKTLVYISVFSFMASCGGDDVEIVSQDTSWTIDNKYIEEDIREQLGIDPFNKLIYFGYASSPVTEMSAIYDMTDVTIKGGDEVNIKVKLSSTFDKDVKFSLMKDEEALKKCPVDIKGYMTMSESNFTSEPQVIKAGEMETTFTLKLKDVNQLTQAPGYILPLVLKLEEEYENLKVSQIRGNYFLKLKVVVRLDNITSSDQPIEGELFNKDVLFTSDSRPSSLSKLNDGSLEGSWYPNNNTSSYLDASFSDKVVLKGIKINVPASGNFCLSKMRVYADTGNGVWIDCGLFERATKTSVAYVKFKKPMECIKVRFAEINPQQADFYEVTFIK